MQALLRVSSVIPAPGLRSGASPKQSSTCGGQILSKNNDVSPPARFPTVARQHRQRQRGRQSTPAGALRPRRFNARRGLSIVVQASSSTSDDQNGEVDNGDENQDEEPTTTPAASGADANKAKTNTDDADADEEEKKTTSEKKDDDEEESSPSALPLADDDVAPALESDWRDFRAMLVSQEATSQATDESSINSDDAVAEASSENLELLKKQNPKLAAEKPWAHVIGAPEKGCLLLASDDEFNVGQEYFHQAVILILEHHDKGTMGVILNRPTQYNMGEGNSRGEGRRG